MSLVQDFSLFAGDTKPVDGSTGVDLTGASVSFDMRQSVESAEVLLHKDSGSGSITITDAPQGLYTFTLSSAETAGLKGYYYYEIKVTDSLDNVTTFTTGTITIAAGQQPLSYATVDFADAYFDNVLFPEPWTTMDATTKEKALRMATKKIDSLALAGIKADPNQPQEFPRARYSQRYGWVPESDIPDCVREATCEEALSLMRAGTEAQKRAELQRQGVTSFSLGSLSETYSGAATSGNKMTSPVAAQLLAPYTGGGRYIG